MLAFNFNIYVGTFCLELSLEFDFLYLSLLTKIQMKTLYTVCISRSLTEYIIIILITIQSTVSYSWRKTCVINDWYPQDVDLQWYQNFYDLLFNFTSWIETSNTSSHWPLMNKNWNLWWKILCCEESLRSNWRTLM